MKTTNLKKDINVAEIEISYKTKIKKSELKQVTSSNESYSVLKEIWSKKMEYV